MRGIVRVCVRNLPDADRDDGVRDGEFFARRVEEDVFADGDDEEGDGGFGPSLLFILWL